MKKMVNIGLWIGCITGFCSLPISLAAQKHLHEKAPFESPVCLQFDENLFLCHWVNNQTFVYGNEKVLSHENQILELVKGNENFCLPAHGKLWSVFKKGHNGLDINLQTGDTIRAAFDGKVRYAQYNKGGFGNLVIIRHYNGLETYYAHLSKFKIKPNQEIKAGQVIGLGGSTGRSRGPHLHFEVRYKDKPLDPFAFIDYTNRSLKTTELELNELVFEPWNHPHIPSTLADSTFVGLYTATPLNEPLGGEERIENEMIKNTPAKKKPTSTVWHVIKKGDSLYALSLKHKTTVKKICSLNGLKETSILQIGKKIRIK